MSTSYSIYRFAKPTKQELSKIDYFEPYESFLVYDVEGEQTNERTSLFREMVLDGIINGKFILPKKIRLTRNCVEGIVTSTEEIIWAKLQECKLKRS